MESSERRHFQLQDAMNSKPESYVLYPQVNLICFSLILVFKYQFQFMNLVDVIFIVII